jgi:F-type H+-transporting ATPase subunit a
MILNKRLRLFSAIAAVMLSGGYLRAESIARELPIQVAGLEFNHNTILMTFVVAVVVCLIAWLCARNLKEIPGKGQVILEMVFGAFDDLVTQSIGNKTSARKYLPWIGSLFLFLWTCNMIGMIPIPHWHIGGEEFRDYNHNGSYDPGEFIAEADGASLLGEENGIHDAGFYMPAFEEPTADYNVPLALALLFVLAIGHGAHIKKHGIIGYVKSYFDPGGVMGVIMFPLNIVGKIAELVSISFRLFGNIFGGVVIIIVVSGLLNHLILPIGLLAFFGVFVGTVQAFVFTMLSLTYISLGIAEDGEE